MSGAEGAQLMDHRQRDSGQQDDGQARVRGRQETLITGDHRTCLLGIDNGHHHHVTCLRHLGRGGEWVGDTGQFGRGVGADVVDRRYAPPAGHADGDTATDHAQADHPGPQFLTVRHAALLAGNSAASATWGR